jgi:hypothetical protein
MTSANAKVKKTLTEFPYVAVQWHPTKNGSITPD